MPHISTTFSTPFNTVRIVVAFSLRGILSRSISSGLIPRTASRHLTGRRITFSIRSQSKLESTMSQFTTGITFSGLPWGIASKLSMVSLYTITFTETRSATSTTSILTRRIRGSTIPSSLEWLISITSFSSIFPPSVLLMGFSPRVNSILPR